MRLGVFLVFPFLCAFAEPAYVGANTCAQCHRNVAAQQSSSNMALTWQGHDIAVLRGDYRRTKIETGIEYHYARKGGRIEYEVSMPDHKPFQTAAETIVGGARHGYSFLVRVPDIDGVKLDRAPLVEARYLHYSSSSELVLSPGFPEQLPSTWETAIGRALSPEFEQKCLNCHGASGRRGHETGVRCESCHGPGSGHLRAIASKAVDKAIVNPGKLTNPEQLRLCGECHAGFTLIQDPVPDDLLISNQVSALEKSQCYIQSGAGLSCTSCHDPHHNATQDEVRTVAACQGCHSTRVEAHAALCPVNKTGDCVHCHMPEAQKGSFHMADHWIRVHPEQSIRAEKYDASDRTRVMPKRLYLRWIVAADREKADAARVELAGGTPFFAVAQKYSTDASAVSGGFLGDFAVKDMDPALATAALKIERGAFSPVVEVKGKPTIVYRMPRDFLYEATQLQLEATRLREQRKFAEASAKYLASLQIYPYFLRSLIFLAVCSGEQGDAQRAAGILQLAVSLYPDDPAAQYNLGIASGSLGRAEDEIRAYQRAIDLEPDLIPAYLNLGSALYSAGRLDEAAQTFGRGIERNPLVATLYHDLAQVYAQQGKTAEASRAAMLAAKIDPKFEMK